MPRKESFVSKRKLYKAKPYSTPAPKCWNTKEVAELYGVSRPTLVRWVNQGLITISKRTRSGAPVWFEHDLFRLQAFLVSHKPYAKERKKAA
jgi:hypothetical protein